MTEHIDRQNTPSDRHRQRDFFFQNLYAVRSIIAYQHMRATLLGLGHLAQASTNDAGEGRTPPLIRQKRRSAAGSTRQKWPRLEHHKQSQLTAYRLDAGLGP